MFALESTPLPCAPPISHVSSFAVNRYPPPVAASGPMAQSHASTSPQYGHRHAQSSIRRPHRSHVSSPVSREGFTRLPPNHDTFRLYPDCVTCDVHTVRSVLYRTSRSVSMCALCRRPLSSTYPVSTQGNSSTAVSSRPRASVRPFAFEAAKEELDLRS